MAWQFSPGAISPKKYFLYVAASLGLLFSQIDQGGDSGARVDWAQEILRLVHWEMQTLGIVFVIISVHMLFDRWRLIERQNGLLKLGVSGFVGSAIFSPIALALDLFFGTEHLGETFWLASLLEWKDMLIPILIGWFAMNVPWLIGFQLQHMEPSTQAKPGAEVGDQGIDESQISASNTEEAFLSLLPESASKDIIYLKSELHYLKVVTKEGSHLVLYSLKDATQEFGSEKGILVHRSYWVAKKHIVKLIKKGRQGELHLSNGELIPVSRRNMSTVSSAGIYSM